MEGFSSLFKKEHMGQLLLAIIFIIYLIMGYKTPEPVANVVDTVIGKVVLFIVVITMFTMTRLEVQNISQEQLVRGMKYIIILTQVKVSVWIMIYH